MLISLYEKSFRKLSLQSYTNMKVCISNSLQDENMLVEVAELLSKLYICHTMGH